MHRVFIFGLLSALSLGCSNFTQGAFAEPKSGLSLDTGEEEEEVHFDPIAVWPEKIVVDVSVQQVMLVWFDAEEPRFTKIPFSDVKSIRTVPKFENKPIELQLQLLDDRKFLLVSWNSQEVSTKAQLLSAIMSKPKELGKKKEFRIYSDAVSDREPPHIVIGNISDSQALKKLSKKTVQSESNSAQGDDKASIGEDVDATKHTGKFNKNTVDMVIKKSMNVFRSCYQRELKKNANLSGDIGVKFSISKDGIVKGAKVDSTTMNNSVVEKCIVKHIYGLQFDPPAGGSAIIVYPFSFSKK